eukprot:238626_1
MSIYFEFVANEEDDYVIYLSLANNKLSFQSMLSSSARILAIFFLKQVYLSYFSSKKGRAAMLKYTPFIKWIGDDHFQDINTVKCSAAKNDENSEPACAGEIDLRAIRTKHAKPEEESISTRDKEINEESYA